MDNFRKGKVYAIRPSHRASWEAAEHAIAKESRHWILLTLSLAILARHLTSVDSVVHLSNRNCSRSSSAPVLLLLLICFFFFCFFFYFTSNKCFRLCRPCRLHHSHSTDPVVCKQPKTWCVWPRASETLFTKKVASRFGMWPELAIVFL